MFEVVFLNEAGKKVLKIFDNYLLCKKFVNRAKYSKRIILISYPNFS